MTSLPRVSRSTNQIAEVDLMPEREQGDTEDADQTLDDIFGSAFGQDWQLQRPTSSLEQGMSAEQRRSYVHYLLGRGEKGAVYHQLWFPGTSLSFSLDPCSTDPPQTPRSASVIGQYSSEQEARPMSRNHYYVGSLGGGNHREPPATPHVFIKRSISAVKNALAHNNHQQLMHYRHENTDNSNADVKTEAPTLRPKSAKTLREMRTVALNAEAVISNQVFDPKKVPKTPRPMSNSVGKKRCRNISQRASETKIVVESPRKIDNEHNLEVTGAPSHLNAQQVRGSPRKSAASLNLIQIIPPSEDRADDEEVMAGTGAEEGLDETTRSLLAIEYPDNKMSDYEKESFVAPLGQSSPRNERIIDEKNEANEEDSQMNSSKISDNSTRSRESRRSMSHQNDEFSTQSSQNESLNDSRLDEEVGLECSRSPRDRAKDETTSQSEKTLEEPKLVRNGNESNFPSEKMSWPKKQKTRENQKSKTSELDQNMSSNNYLNTTFESDTSCVQPSVNRPYTVPEYKIEKYNVPELRPKSASAREKSQSKQVSDSVQNFHLPKEVQQRYDIISDEPWGFESYYEPLLPGNYQKLDLDYLATTNAKDWRNSISDICHPDEVETGLLDRLLEIAKQQSATVKLEEELKRRPRYMRPRSSQLSTAASVASASAVGTSGDTYAPSSRQTPPAPPSLPRARSALASLSSRFCPECKHIPCSDSCRYQVQQTGASTKVAPLFKRCYLCRQMNCPGSNNCASHQKMKQIHSARYERRKSSTSSKSSAVGSAGSEGRPTNRLLAIEYHHDRSYATSLANQKRLIKMTNKTNRSSSRPKSAGSSSARRNQARQENTLRNQRKEIGVRESGSRSSLNQVDLSNHLADNLDFESAHRPANGAYLPKPPPTGRDILTLEQRLSVLAMPANKLSRCKSSAAPAGNNMEIQTFKPRKSKSPRSTDGMWRSSRESRGNSSNGTSIVELLVPRIAVPSQPEPPPVYVSVYRSHNVATGTGRFRGTKRLGGRMTAFT